MCNGRPRQRVSGWSVIRLINLCAQLHNYNIIMNDDWTKEDQAIVLERDDNSGQDIFSIASHCGEAADGHQVLENVMEHALSFTNLGDFFGSTLIIRIPCIVQLSILGY